MLWLIACTNADSDADTDVGEIPDVPPAWDSAPEPLPCGAEEEAALLDEALADAGTDRDGVGITAEEYDRAPYSKYLDDAFLLAGFRGMQREPLKVSCVADDRAAAVRGFAANGHPGSGAVREAMTILGEAWPETPLDPAGIDGDTGLARLLDALGDDPVALGELPDGLGDALGPVFAAMADVVVAWDVMALDAPEKATDLAKYGHGGVMIDLDAKPDLADAGVQDWILGVSGPRVLYGPSARLAFLIESTDWSRFAGAGAEGEILRVPTSAGAIVVTGPGADASDDEEVLFWLDLGGDDTWRHQAGGNPTGEALGVMIDLGGDDQYGYVEDPDPHDAGRLVSDADGRYRGDSNYGPFSFSRLGRQGSGRFGVGMLYDVGAGTDTYTSLRMSQGWAHLGVGVLVDDGGDDTYRGEAGVQGGAAMGIGAAIDLGGDDRRETYTDSQGFAYVQAVGILADLGETKDVYFANTGTKALGGDPLYASAQMPGTANNSFCQGAGFGRRGDADGGFLSGGFGMLVDGGGDDAYTAAVFAQGTGYWQSFGVLWDGGGNDTYDAYWYVQGAAAHYSIGALLDGGGDDKLNPTMVPVNMHAGAGHDMSIGVYVDESGDDQYHTISLAAGASNCQGVGLFADNDGSDEYFAASSYAYGLGNRSTECESGARSNSDSVGIFLDSGADPDVYHWPDASRAPADDTAFGIEWSADEHEHGGAVDGDGETSLHAR